MRNCAKPKGHLSAPPTHTIKSQAAKNRLHGHEEAVRTCTRQMNILKRVILLGSRAKDLDALLSQILENVLELMVCEGGDIYLVDEVNRVAEIWTAKGLSPDFLEKVNRVKMDEWPYRLVFIDKTPVLSQHFEVCVSETCAQAGYKSFASIPVVTEGKVIGALNVASRKRSAFTWEEERLLESIGREAGTAIARMLAQEGLCKRDAILEAVSLASERLLRAPSWETCIQEILARLGQATRVSRVYVFENRKAADGTLLADQRFEWVAKGVASQMGNPNVHDTP